MGAQSKVTHFFFASTLRLGSGLRCSRSSVLQELWRAAAAGGATGGSSMIETSTRWDPVQQGLALSVVVVCSLTLPCYAVLQAPNVASPTYSDDLPLAKRFCLRRPAGELWPPEQVECFTRFWCSHFLASAGQPEGSEQRGSRRQVSIVFSASQLTWKSCQG